MCTATPDHRTGVRRVLAGLTMTKMEGKHSGGVVMFKGSVEYTLNGATS